MATDKPLMSELGAFGGAFPEASAATNDVLDILARHLDSVPFPIFIYDRDYTVRYANRAACYFANSPAAQLVGRQCQNVLCASICRGNDCPGKAALETGHTVVEEAVCNKQHYRVHIVPLQTPAGVVSGLLEILMDITDLKRKEQIEEEFSPALKTTMDAFWVSDIEGKILHVNDSLCELLGYSMEELLKMDVYDITYNKAREAILGHKADAACHGSARFECWNKRKDGSTVCTNVIITYHPSSNRFCGLLRDITKQKASEDKIAFLSYHDPMTGLKNQAFFEEECCRLEDMGSYPVSIILGDINGLKLINYFLGFACGNHLLCTVSGILLHNAREGNVVARLGGDEFCILMADTTLEEARRIVKRIYTKFQATTLRLNGQSFTGSISLGFATRSAGQPMIDVLRNAENSMNKHKMLQSKSILSSLVANIRATMFEKSYETREHADRLTRLACKVGKIMGLTYDQMNDLELLGILHDIGKIGVNGDILNKAESLTEVEWDELKRHPQIGYRIVMALPELSSVAEGILCHHERWDGGGYPQGLSGESIPLLSRIISVVDSFDAMTNDRVYHRAMSFEEAKHEILINAGKQFDPMVVQVFLRVLRKAS